jgi:hypothetical protein
MKRGVMIALAATGLTAACGDVNGALARLAEARHRTADMQIQFVKASSAADRAVMADTDAASVAFAREDAAALQAVHGDASALRPLLAGPGFTDEVRLLDVFETQLAAYETLDRQIRDLAVENTNLKAQRLSFGAAQAAADAFEQAIGSVQAAAEGERWRVRTEAFTAIAAVRKIQVLQAPHIAALDDAAMGGLEQRMQAESATARDALAALARLVDAASRPKLATAADALARFLDVNSQILGLSRRNTNVRSLVLALNEKQKLVTPCEQSLAALSDALAHRGYPKGRWD